MEQRDRSDVLSLRFSNLVVFPKPRGHDLATLDLSHNYIEECGEIPPSVSTLLLQVGPPPCSASVSGPHVPTVVCIRDYVGASSARECAAERECLTASKNVGDGV